MVIYELINPRSFSIIWMMFIILLLYIYIYISSYQRFKECPEFSSCFPRQEVCYAPGSRWGYQLYPRQVGWVPERLDVTVIPINLYVRGRGSWFDQRKVWLENFRVADFSMNSTSRSTIVTVVKVVVVVAAVVVVVMLKTVVVCVVVVLDRKVRLANVFFWLNNP